MKGVADPRRLRVARLTRPTLAIAALAAFAALGVVLALRSDGEVVAAHNAALLSLGLGVAIFAVNFSLLAFQLAPYRTLVRGIPRRQVLGALMLITLALLPLVGFLCSDRLVGQLAVGVIPSLAYGSLVLALVASHEADPVTLLNRRLSVRALDGFFRRFSKAIRVELRRRGDDDGQPSGGGDDGDDGDNGQPNIPPPMHEVFHRTPPPAQADDPLEFLVRIANAAITNGDTFTYAAAVDRSLVITRDVVDRDEPDDDVPGDKVEAALEDHARAALGRIGRAAAEEKVPEEFAERFVIACGHYLEDEAAAGRAGKEPTLRILSAASGIAAELVKRGATGAPVGLLVVIRGAAEKGMESLSEGDFDRFYLVAYPGVVEELGKEAVRNGDADFLYRCLDTLCWMGSAAVRSGAGYVGRSCLQALAQLGREARAAGLECFWTRCALTPADHADERLEWIVSWVPQAKNDRSGWLSSIGAAFSRLRGYRCELTLDESGEKPRVVFKKLQNVPHTESIDDMGRVRTVDYSDFSVTKELQLY